MRHRRRLRPPRGQDASPSASSPRKPPAAARRASRRSGRSDSARLIGQPLPRLDLPAKSDGSLRFAGDVRLPDMLFASARLAPPGGRLTGFSRAGAAARAGRSQRRRSRRLARGRRRQLVGGRARAQGRQPALHRPGRRHARPPAAVRRGARPTARRSEWFERGDYDVGDRRARAPLAATYCVAPAQHLGLEPLTATARVQRRPARSLGADPGARLARAAAAEAAAMRGARTLYPMPVGDPGGRALESRRDPDRGRAGARAQAPGAADPAAKRRARTTTGSRPARWRG